MGGACTTLGENLNACRAVVGKIGRKRSLGRPRCSWEDRIKISLKKWSERA
jgi:hypothetical protein